MWQTILRTKDAALIQKRLNALTEHAVRRWGTMNPAEMCWHCRQQLEFVLDPTPIPVLKTFMRFRPFGWLTIYLIPWPHDAKTAPSMHAAKNKAAIGAFADEKQKLLKALHAVIEKKDISAIHPLFGLLNRKDWGRLIWKHIDHHLRQFSC